MPRSRKSDKEKIKDAIATYGEAVFCLEKYHSDDSLYCMLCATHDAQRVHQHTITDTLTTTKIN